MIGQAVVAAAVVIVLYVVVPIVTIRRRRRATLAVAWALYRAGIPRLTFARMLHEWERAMKGLAVAMTAAGPTIAELATSFARLGEQMQSSLPSAKKLPRRFSPTVSPTGGVSDDD